MAKVTAPLMSLDASGSIASSIVFSKWKGRNYVRQLVKPANPRSVKQISVRAMITFLSQAWAALSAPDKATWAVIAAANNVSPFNAYVQFNQRRWGNFLSPTEAYPAAAVGVVATLTTQTANGGVGMITISTDLNAVNQNWGLLIFRSLLTGFTPAFDNMIAAIVEQSTAAVAYVDTPLTPAAYFYRTIPFTSDGVLGSAFAEITATAT